MILLKLLKVSFYFVRFFCKGTPIALFVSDKNKRHTLHSQNAADTSKKLLKMFNFDVKVTNPEALSILDTTNHLIVANHVSYLDILIMNTIKPLLYITSTDMQKAPVLGQITQLGGSLYTERKKFSGIKGEITNFAQFLKDGFDVVLYPEATSTNGKALRKFRKSLFQIAIEANRPILPLCIKYTEIDGKPISDANRDFICWYGDMTFVPHFLKVLTLKNVKVEITVLDEIKLTADCDRKSLSNRAFEIISNKYFSYSEI